MLDPAAEEMVFAGNPKSVNRGGDNGNAPIGNVIADRVPTMPQDVMADFFGQLRTDFLIRIEAEDPFTSGSIEGGVLLGGKAFPLLDEDFCPVGLRDLHRVVSGTRVDDNEFGASPGHERLEAFERAFEIVFLVVGDEDDRERHGLQA